MRRERKDLFPNVRKTFVWTWHLCMECAEEHRFETMYICDSQHSNLCKWCSFGSIQRASEMFDKEYQRRRSAGLADAAQSVPPPPPMRRVGGW